MHFIFAAIPPEEVMYGYGPLGVIVVALGYFAYKMFNIVLRDRDKAISDRDAMIQDVFTKVLPAIVRNSEFLESRQEVDRELVQALKDNNKVFDEVLFVLKHGGDNHRVGGR